MNSFQNKSNLEKYYNLFLEIGLILSLLLFVVLMNIPIRETAGRELVLADQQEIISIEEVEQTRQEERPPPPPRPTAPVEVPNDEVIEEQVLNIDAELDLSDEVQLPPPPDVEEKKEKDPDEDFFVIVEQMPELVGGLRSIQQQIVYPEKARIAGIEGRVIIQFIVNEEGKVENPRVIRGIGGGCDEEALRVVRTARFEPGRQRGKPVRVQFSLPIVFQLQN